MERGPLAPEVGKPDRHPGRVAGAVRPRSPSAARCRRRVAAEPPTTLPTQSAKRAPALLGPPIITCPATMLGRVVRPGTSFHSSVTTQTMRVAPKMARTSPGRLAPATICSQKASIDPPAKAVGVPGRQPSDAPIWPTTGSWSSPTPSSSRASLFHRPRRVQTAEGGGGGRVDGGDAGQGVGGHRPGSSSSRRRPGCWPTAQAEHAPSLLPLPARVARGSAGATPSDRRLPGPAVAVEQAGKEGPAPAVDGGDRGDHRGDHHPGRRAVELGRDGGEGLARAPAPGLGHIVLEEVGGRACPPGGAPWPGPARYRRRRRRPP